MRQIIELERACSGKIDWTTVVAGGCHDLIEDSYSRPTPVTPEIIRRAFSQGGDEKFGSDVAFLVEAVSKRRREEFSSKAARLAEYHARLFAAARRDHRVLLIKYPDRNHNLATLHGLTTTDPSKVQRVAQETLDFYVRKGRDMALRILPECYHVEFGRMVNRMERLALAYLIDEYSVYYEHV
jgi:(p)ppGpp synthase/HD superfamily hydrolase